MFKKLFYLALLVGILSIVLVPIPSQEMDYSHVVYDKNGALLTATIAEDEQWRFPLKDTLPLFFKQCVIEFEDAYFYQHLGVNPISIFKAFQANIKAGKVVRGGSTISMQLMRMHRGNRQRSYSQKIVEVLGAIKLELMYSKEDILKMWASIAPFGGNTVGAETAAWRYFGRELGQLSQAEYATLAILPNAPSYVNMEKNVHKLKVKRQRLLHKLKSAGKLDSIDYALAIDEDIFFDHIAMPQKSIHFLDFLRMKNPDQYQFNTTIQLYHQNLLNRIVEEHSNLYAFDGIQNVAATIVDVSSNELLAYVGNNPKGKPFSFVDCAQAPRSYGSLLKPFLYAYSLENGMLLPNEKVKDIPTNVAGFTPKNFDKKFRGMVPFSDMVSKSLNVPAIRVLNYVGLEGFHSLLKRDLKLRYLDKDPFHHGLSLILGGAEASLWEMSRLYKGLAQNHTDHPNPYNEITYIKGNVDTTLSYSFHPSTIRSTLEVMQSLRRPKKEQHFTKMNGQSIAWKTGTSYGHRDAWSIGVNGKYMVAVWVGNEQGDGVFNLTGVTKAAPILFSVMRYLEEESGLGNQEVSNEIPIETCGQSGMLKGRLCTSITTEWVHNISHKWRNCTLHNVISDDHNNIVDTIFEMDAISSHYYDKFHGFQNQNMVQLTSSASKRFEIVYPEKDAVIFVPKNLESNYTQVNFRASSNQKDIKLFWYLNEEFIGVTTTNHQISLSLPSGDHELNVTDELGDQRTVLFSVARR